MSVQVKALQDGFYKGSLVYKGSVFFVDSDKVGKWMLPLTNEDTANKHAVTKPVATTGKKAKGEDAELA